MTIPDEIQRHLTRRAFLQKSTTGIGALALTSLFSRDLFAAGGNPSVPGALGQLHFPAKAKRIIYLFMSGAPSHLDLFDPKPTLVEMTGKDLPDSVRPNKERAIDRVRVPVWEWMCDRVEIGEGNNPAEIGRASCRERV